mmetsp:Transcript_76417/g.184934  ORF Transcript_76417/g.184934 Transcript_76417/m.184934 type:complete len:444 (+) Transcript_76417:54-1385(+)
MLRIVLLASAASSVVGGYRVVDSEATSGDTKPIPGLSGIPWFFTKHAAKAGRRIQDPNEVVHFFSVGDWGAQPYEPMGINGGSMHHSCARQKEAKRCQPDGEEWLREENAQQRVTQQMLKVAQEKPISWVVNVGDNFYFDGVDSTHHWHWRTSFESMYSDPAFHVPWFSVLGNHDYGGDCCAADLFGGAKDKEGILGGMLGRARPTAQFDYDTEHEWTWPQEKARRWVMPFFNWTKVVDLGPYKVQFFAIDTNVADTAKQCVKCGGCSNTGAHPAVLALGCAPESSPGGQCTCFLQRLWSEQLNFLERELAASSRDSSIAWRFLIGHHPWNFLPRQRSDGLDRLLQLLKDYNVQVHFAGHVHSMRHDVIQDSLAMVMTGSSGGYQYDGGEAPRGDRHGRTVWSSQFMDYGFAHMEMTQSELKVNYINDNGDLRQTVVVPARKA